MFRFLLLALCLALAAAFTAPASALRGSRSSIVMDGYKTGTWGAYKAPDGPQKPGAKGNPLWGYTVGSRAPDAAIASGTTKGEQEKWNLANLFKKAAPPPPKAKGSRMKRPGTI
mmetsp:Transcript_19380/g.61711  ORF Transcript_19380/g.61711 Transcript_19380/m.61711 type:complete len:114 (-) Transcript_19380:423-764(-)